jgi:hypothetical protein
VLPDNQGGAVSTGLIKLVYQHNPVPLTAPPKGGASASFRWSFVRFKQQGDTVEFLYEQHNTESR